MPLAKEQPLPELCQQVFESRLKLTSFRSTLPLPSLFICIHQPLIEYIVPTRMQLINVEYKESNDIIVFVI